jgi:hypothetical protein
MDQVGVIAALEVKIRLLGQAIVHHDGEPVRSAERRDRTRLTIEKQRLNLLLASDVHVASEQSPEFVKPDMARRGKQREHEPIAALQNDCFDDAVRRKHELICNIAIEEILRESDCDAHDLLLRG